MLQLSVFDQKGVQFDNFTSCSVRWTSSEPGLLSLCPQSTMKVADRLTQAGYKLHGVFGFALHFLVQCGIGNGIVHPK